MQLAYVVIWIYKQRKKHASIHTATLSCLVTVSGLWNQISDVVHKKLDDPRWQTVGQYWYAFARKAVTSQLTTLNISKVPFLTTFVGVNIAHLFPIPPTP